MERSSRLVMLFLCVIAVVLLLSACAYAETTIDIQPLSPAPSGTATIMVTQGCPDPMYALLSTSASYTSPYHISFNLYIRDLRQSGQFVIPLYTPISGSRSVSIGDAGTYTVQAHVYKVNYDMTSQVLWDTAATTFNVTPVPEPSSVLALLGGLSSLALTRRFRRN